MRARFNTNLLLDVYIRIRGTVGERVLDATAFINFA
jgi:hypothetical protein